jgi:hypothetical protein
VTPDGGCSVGRFTYVTVRLQFRYDGRERFFLGFAKFGILTAERSGDLVGFVVGACWTARGFIETNPAAEALASVAASEGAALRAHFAPALTFLRHAYPMTQCGMTRYQLVDAQNQDQTIDLVLRDGRLVAAREEHEPPDN